MIRLGGWCARRPRGAAGPAERRGVSGGPGSRALRVLVDMDGVLADFEGGFLKKFRARFPDLPFVALEDRRGFWVSEQYGRLRPGLSEKAISIWESKNFFFELEPLPGAVEAVKQMANLQNTDVFICTSPIKMFKYCPYEKYAWVEKHFGPDFLEQIVLTRDKTIISADLLIDDRLDIIDFITSLALKTMRSILWGYQIAPAEGTDLSNPDTMLSQQLKHQRKDPEVGSACISDNPGGASVTSALVHTFH